MRNNNPNHKRYISQPNNYNHQNHNANYTPQTNTPNIINNNNLSHSYNQPSSQAMPYTDNRLNLSNSYNYNNNYGQNIINRNPRQPIVYQNQNPNYNNNNINDIMINTVNDTIIHNNITNQNNNNNNNGITMYQGHDLLGTDFIMPVGESQNQGNNSYLDGPVKLISKHNINIIFYDGNINSEINQNICSYFKLKSEGTIYGVDDYNLFTYICKQIQKNNKCFILLSSGACAKDLFNYCEKKNINNIYKYYILCAHIEKYLPLKNIYPKLEDKLKDKLKVNIFNDIDVLKKEIVNPNNYVKENIPIKSSNFIFLEDYNNIYIKFHFEIVRKFFLYKLLKSKNMDKSKFMELIKNKNDYYKNMARELINIDDEVLIKFFKNIKNEAILKKVFNNSHNIQGYISNYTQECFYYENINKSLREGDYKTFRILSNHLAKFIYHLLEYKKTINQKNDNILYRYMYISKDEFQYYQNSIGRKICYPSFTSTTAKDKGFTPFQNGPNLEMVKLIIKQNYSKSIICIREISEHKTEEEYLCLPFTFFRIDKVEINKNNNIYGNIYLTALNSEKPIEDMYLEFMQNETDNLDPEGLDMLKLTNNNSTTLIINPYLKKEVYKKNKYNF